MRIRLNTYREMERLRDQAIVSQLTKLEAIRLLDLGGGNGRRTKTWAEAAKVKEVVLVDRDNIEAKEAKRSGLDTVIADVGSKLPFKEGSFDLVISNQVMEHLADLDSFVCEIKRVASSNGKVVVSTENLSAWENIFALILGYRPFSCEYSRCGIGNPFSLQYYENELGMHVKVLSFKSLKELFLVHGVHVQKMVGSGTPFLPWRWAMKLASRVDPVHSRFITLIGRVTK